MRLETPNSQPLPFYSFTGRVFSEFQLCARRGGWGSGMAETITVIIRLSLPGVEQGWALTSADSLGHLLYTRQELVFLSPFYRRGS